jgi:hypothetical protein
MTHDHTYLSQLRVTDLIEYAHRGNWTGPEAHMIRALEERLEEHLDIIADYDEALMDANRRAESWREEAMAVQRQLDMVRG